LENDAWFETSGNTYAESIVYPSISSVEIVILELKEVYGI
jgi:hypothetical protein